jgi:hypothetical protein
MRKERGEGLVASPAATSGVSKRLIDVHMPGVTPLTLASATIIAS